MSDDLDGVGPPVDRPRLPSSQLPSPAPVIDEPRLPDHAHGSAVPTGVEPVAHGRRAADVAKRAMRKRRRRNTLVGRVAGIGVLATLAGVGYASYRAFENDQDGAGGESDSVAVDAGEAASPGALTSPVEISSILPSDIALMATPLDPVDGFTRYLVDADLAMNAQRQSAADWFALLRSLPQSEGLLSASVIPDLNSGQMAIAYQSPDGVSIDRLIVWSPDYDIAIDAVAP